MRKKRLVFFIFFIIMTSSLFILRSKGSKNHPSNPSIILISIDTLNVSHMGIYGYNKDTTPSIDSFAKEAVTFTNAYTISPITIHSFYTLFTGRNDVFAKGSHSRRVPEFKTNIPTLPKIAKDNGLITAAFITNPLLGIIEKNFFSHGFLDFAYSNSSNDKNYTNIFAHEFQNAKLTTEKALNWLTRNKDKRFFLWVHLTTPHQPYNPPMKYICAIDKGCSVKKYRELLADTSTNMQKTLPHCTGLVSKESIEKAKNLYDAEILASDEEVGKLIDGLKKAGIYNNSIIIFYADHGEGFDHDIFEHGKVVYNSNIHIPLIIKAPNIKGGMVVSELIDNADILPTILDLNTIKYDKNQFSGLSFTSILNDNLASQGDALEKKYVYSLTPTDETNRFSITDGTYKYIYSNYNDEIYKKNSYCLYQGATEELYNLKQDPNELRNLKDIEPARAEQLKNLLFREIDKRDKIKPTEEDKEKLEKLKQLGY